jgi:hypothetical protein
VTKSGTSASTSAPTARAKSGQVCSGFAVNVSCPVEGCGWVYGSKDGKLTAAGAKNGLWHHLQYMAVKGSKAPNKMAFEKAHAKAHKEMKDAGSKSNSHMAPSALSLVLTAVSIEPKESHLERTRKSARDFCNNRPESMKPGRARSCGTNQ